MFFIHWLSQTSRRNTSIRQPHRDRTKERRLKLLRLEQRRVLNADFTFVAHGLNLDHVDGDLTVREVSGSTGHQIEFDLAGGSLWNDNGSTGLFAIDNSLPDHSILSIAKSDLESLSAGVSLHAAASEFDLQFDVQSSALDLSQMHGTLVAEGFGQIHETSANDHQVQLGDVSLSADHITLSQFHADDITLTANEIDLTGGANSFYGSTLSIHSAATPNIELGGISDSVHELNFSDSDITALDASFHRISFEATSTDASSSIHVDLPGADFHHAITPGHEISLHLTADSVQIDGALSISGGLIDVTATHAATISATGSLTSHGGDVHVDAGQSGTLLDSGRIDVSNSELGGMGGTVHLLGEQVGLFGHAEVDASGDHGGGVVLIGGDLHGHNDSIHHAAQTFLGHDVEIHADAIHQGDGGQVVVWSDEVTQVYGALTARGGDQSGDGGFIETSSHQQLIVTRGGDASAAHGNGGTWLLDPFDVTIVDNSTVFLVTEFNQPPFFTPSISGSEVTDDAIEEQLNAGTTVVISTFNPDGTEAGNVTQNKDASIDVTFANAGDSATFIISAANDIFINGGFTAKNGSLNVLLEANTGSDDLDTAFGNVNINANIDTNGGSFTSTGVNFDSAGINAGNTAATITATGGVSITQTGIVDLGVINTGTDSGGTTFISGANVRGTITVGEGNVFIDGGNPDLVVMADISATGTIFLLADQDVIVEATVTAGGPGTPLDPSADLSITSDADSDGVGGFWLREGGNAADARLDAGGNITIVGAKLVDNDGNPGGGKISLRIDADDALTPQQQIVAGQDLTILANFGKVPNAGDIVIDGMMTATDGALTVFFTDTAFLSANQSAGTDLLFQNAVRLTDNVTLTAGNDVTIASTLDDDGESTTGSALTVMAGGDVLFVGKIGSLVIPELDSLTITGDGLIDFLNSVTVDGNIAVTATSETGRVTFQDAVTTTNNGLVSNLGSVTITNSGLLVTSSSAQFNVDGNFVQNGTGSTELGAGITTANGDVSFAQGVLLTRAQQTATPPGFNPVTTIDTSAGNGSITFGGTIDSEVTGANEEQTVSLANPTSFDLSWIPPQLAGGDPIATATANIPSNATAEEVRQAFVAAVNLRYQAAASLTITYRDINVVGDPGGPYTLVFQGVFRGTNVNQVTVTGAGLSVLTTLPGQKIVAEHNPLTLIAGIGKIEFQGDIGVGFVDVGLGVDGDQTPGNLTINSASRVTFNAVATVATHGTINIGAVSVITDNDASTNDISIITNIGGPNSTTFESGASIRINGQTRSAVDLSLLAARDVMLTNDGSLSTSGGHNVTIVADADGNSVGDFRMGALTQINAGSGFIDVRAAEVFLGKLITTNANPTDAENPAIRVIATFRSINDINGDANSTGANLVAEQRTDPTAPGAGVVLEAVLGIGSTNNALETNIASLSAFNHDLSEQQVVTLENATGGTFTLTWTPPGTAAAKESTAAIPFNASAGQVKVAFLKTFDTLTDADLDVSGIAGGPYIFTFLGALRATNVADLTASNANLIGSVATVEATTISNPRPAENNIVIRDVGTNTGNRVDLIFVHNQANPLTTGDTQRGVIDINVAGDLRVVEDISRLLLLEMRAGIDSAGDRAVAAVQSENTIRLTANTIEILDDLLAIQDSAPNDKGIGELIEINARVNFVLGADRVITTDENYVTSFSEDRNGNGLLDRGEDVNGNGQLDLNRDGKPRTFANDANRDRIQITADFDRVGADGTVLLRENSTISTDSGIEQQISPRPVKQPSDAQKFIYTTDSAFFSGEVLVSNLDSDGFEGSTPLYIGTLTFKIGVAGEKNLVLDIDWGDRTPAFHANAGFPIESPNGVFLFDRVTNRTATRFLIPEGGHTYVIPHQYRQTEIDNPGPQPGRNLTSDPLQVRFAVSQHPSISILGRAVFNPDGSGPVVPVNHPSDNPTEPRGVVHEGLFLLSSTDVSDTPTALLPRFDNGVAAFTIPTPPSSPISPTDVVIPPPALPSPFIPNPVLITAPPITTESSRSSGGSTSITTDEYFVLKRLNEDGSTIESRLTELEGESLLKRSKFEEYVGELGDGEYEILFVTRETRDGTKIERSVIQFRLESGRLAPPANDSPNLFQPFRLIPVPKEKLIPVPNAPKPVPPNADGAASDPNSDAQAAAEIPLPGLSKMPDLFSDAGYRKDDALALSGTALAAGDSTIESTTSDPSDSSAMAVGLLLLAGTRWRKNRFNPFGTSLFSKTARLARKRVAPADDQ